MATMTELLDRFQHHIETHRLCKRERDRILVAVSGGKDSMLLLDLFVRGEYEIGVAHCNFKLRGKASDDDEQFVRQKAAALNLPYFVKHFETESYASEQGISIQMAARELRYQWFESVRTQAGYDYVAVAHHAGDNVETVLINLLRGTGLRGLRGILPKQNRIIRPLLFMSLDEVVDAVKSFPVIYREDASNRSTEYMRNKIRLEVVPLLRDINPQLTATMTQNMVVAQDSLAFIDQQMQIIRQDVFREEDGGLSLDLITLKTHHPFRFILHELLEPFGFTPALSHDVAKVLEEDRTKRFAGQRFLSPTHILYLDRDLGFLCTKDWIDIDRQAQTMDRKNPEAQWGGHRFQMIHHTTGHVLPGEAVSDLVSFDAHKVRLPITIRSWKEGDIFKPIGMDGRRKKVSDFFVSKKIPLWKKHRIPMVTDATGQILWIVPYRTTEEHQVHTKTKDVLTIAYFYKDG